MPNTIDADKFWWGTEYVCAMNRSMGSWIQHNQTWWRLVKETWERVSRFHKKEEALRIFSPTEIALYEEFKEYLIDGGGRNWNDYLPSMEEVIINTEKGIISMAHAYRLKLSLIPNGSLRIIIVDKVLDFRWKTSN